MVSSFAAAVRQMIARFRSLRELQRGKPANTVAEPAPPKRAERAKARGKSELRRAVRRVTPGQGDLKESGTENTQLTIGGP